MYVSTRNVWYLVLSAQIRSSGLLLGLPLLLFLICMSFKSGISSPNYFHAPSFPGPKPVTIDKDLGVTSTTCILLSLHPLMTNQSLFLAPFLGCYSVLLSTDRSSMFIINPEV